MSKVTSRKQLAANRDNARNSTGPATPEGKLASSRNAIKHGLLARDVVITGPRTAERQADFDAFLADLVEELQPRSLIEQTLVERIATCYWRLHRVQRFEKGAIRQSLETPRFTSAPLAQMEESLHHQRRRLADMDRLANLFDTPLDSLTQADKVEWTQLIDNVPQPYPRPLIDSWPPMDPAQLRNRLPQMRAEQEARIKSIEQQIKHLIEQDQLECSRKPLLDSLPDDPNLLRLIRYETMLDRQIHRALAELRRCREHGQRQEP